MYPFGYGLTYTQFAYSGLKTEQDTYASDEVISLSVEVQNTGGRPADEVVQVYVHRIDGSVAWPEKELKAFARVSLQAGEKQTVQLNVPVKGLRYWDETSHAWKDDLCNIELLVGASSGDIRLTRKVTLH